MKLALRRNPGSLALAVLAGAALAAVVAGLTPGRSRGDDGNKVLGSYQLAITVLNPPLGTFTDLMTFSPGGGVVSTRTEYIVGLPVGPILESPGHGAWSHVKQDDYQVALVNLVQGAPGNVNLPNGAFFATERIHWDLTVDNKTGNLSGPWSSTFTAPNGQVVLAVSGVITAVPISTP